MNGSRRTTAVWILTLALVGVAATGCGQNVAGGGTPKQQSISQTNPSSTPSGGSKKHPQTSKTPAQGAQQAGGAAKGAGTGAQPIKTVTVKVTSSPLILTPVSQGSSTSSFVPVTSTVQSILVPIGWKMQSDAVGSQATIIRMMSPTDPSQVVNEVVQSSQRDLQGFYSQMAAGSAKWWTPGTVVRFTLKNPNSPYLDQGIAANLQGGGSIRVDIYLPSAQAAEASQILHSFLTQAPSPSTSTSTAGG